MSTALLNLSLGGVQLTIIVLARRDDASTFEVGLAVAMGSCGGILGAIIAPRLIERLGRLRSVLLTDWVAALTIAALAVAPGFLGLGAVFALMFFLLPPANAVISATLYRLIPDELRGRVFSLLDLLSGALGAGGPILAGELLVTTSHLEPALLAIPAAMGAAIFSFTPALRAFTNRPAATQC